MPPGTKEVKEERSTALAQQIAHLAGCPQTRIEAYSAETPKGDALEVARCIECGEFAKRKVKDGRHEERQEA